MGDFARNPSGKSEPPQSVAPVVPPNVSYAILHSFGDGSVAQDGENPCGSLVQGSDGNLFGVTQELTIDHSGNGTTIFVSGKRGTIFKVAPDGKVTVLHVFAPKDPEAGAVPESSLTAGMDGNLYGAIPGGGENGCGYFFKITTQGVLTPLHQFGDPRFKDDPRGIDAPFVQGPDGEFYGTDDFGGAAGHGSVFKITGSGVVTTLHSFSDGTMPNDGAMCRNPVAFGSDGDLYGTTFSGPLKGTMPDFKGTLFKITSAGKYTILHRFADGTIPKDGKGSGKVGLFLAGDHILYATTDSGGSGSGNFFKFTPEGAVTILHVYGDATIKDGAFPQPTLVEGRDGNFYGATSAGGFQENGTLYRITPGGAVTILHNFGDGTLPNDGIAPGGGLVLASDGYFYGTTTQGGSAGKGTVFRIKLP